MAMPLKEGQHGSEAAGVSGHGKGPAQEEQDLGT